MYYALKSAAVAVTAEEGIGLAKSHVDLDSLQGAPTLPTLNGCAMVKNMQ